MNISTLEVLQNILKGEQKVWLITGVAGFIGSNLLEALLKLNQRVVGLDNLSTGYKHNLNEVQSLVGPKQWSNFYFIEGDICDLSSCSQACKGVDFVLHQAALGSVPRSINDPIITNQNNVDGFLNVLVAARNAKVKRFVYAASSSTYGNHPDLPKIEEKIGNPLSPYAVTKLVNELYADVFGRTYGLQSIGLRYFNIFGRRQDPEGAYAAVIPSWVAAMIKHESVYINGDGETSRDFCYIDNVLQANLLAATVSDSFINQTNGERKSPVNQVYNIAIGERTNLNQLYYSLQNNLVKQFPYLKGIHPVYRDFREGDVLHSLASIEKARNLLGYQPTHQIDEGLTEAMTWYCNSLLQRDRN